MEEIGIGVNEIRSINQMSLETFTFNKENMFESPADLVIKKLMKEKVEAKKEHDMWLKVKNEELSKLENEDERFEITAEIHTHEYNIEEYYRCEELWALMEMKIIYLYKFFEINIKKLLSISFPNSNTKDFFRWDSLINFLKSKY